jgi:sugar/nucleoside kinase (ribokinase family)
MARILCIGDIMLDVTALIGKEIQPGVEMRAKISTQGGGAAANVASWLAANQTPTFLVARVGADAAGKTVIDELNQYGVEHSHNVIEGARTGVVIVLVDDLGERTMFPDSGANAGISPTDLPPLDGFDAMYLSGYSLVNPISRAGILEIIAIAKEQKLPIIFDPSTVGVLLEVGVGKVREWLSLMDVILLNEEEAHFLSGKSNPVDAAADLLTFAQCVVIKRGAIGALGASRESSVLQVPAAPTTVIDTTGAGDAFAAGFIQIWSEGGPLVDALTRGAELAGRCVAHIGSRPLVAPKE